MSAWSQISSAARSLREVVVSVAMIGGFLVAGVMGWQSLQEKPTRLEVDSKIAAGTEERDEMRKTLEKHGKLLDRFGRVQGYQIAQARWQGDVLTHIAQKRRGTPPPRPERLRQLADNLLSTQ